MFRLLSVVPLAVVLFAGPAFGQAPYPSKPIRLINPFPPGGSIDVVGRPVIDKLRVQWGQPVVMDYRAGGGTIIGASAVATARTGTRFMAPRASMRSFRAYIRSCRSIP